MIFIKRGRQLTVTSKWLNLHKSTLLNLAWIEEKLFNHIFCQLLGNKWNEYLLNAIICETTDYFFMELLITLENLMRDLASLISPFIYFFVLLLLMELLFKWKLEYPWNKEWLTGILWPSIYYRLSVCLWNIPSFRKYESRLNL